ncbi:25S rRNA (adenine2142-N1)-methyltransferase [Microbotryomycetes sp. JL201]|nr:25S rRNA (adenine2142-N1)-methyltransferase [Microbotryomycetes sp. JL201]
MYADSRTKEAAHKLTIKLFFTPRPHTNNRFANPASRKAKRAGNKPKFLQKNTAANKNKTTTTKDGHEEDGDSESVAGRDDESRAAKVKLIREFHTIEKQLASPALVDPAERQRLINRQQELGGLRAYQGASVHGGDKARGGETGKWCVKQLKELKVGLPSSSIASDSKGKQKAVEPTINADGTKTWPKQQRDKLRLLDVGAINGTSYSGYKWIETTSIDLNSGSDNVIQCDFFEFPVPERKFDVVGLSLVVNFEGSLTKRAEMLVHAHRYLKPEGLLYLVLPLPCLTNSRYTSHERLEQILKSTGWKPVRKHDSAKLTYWLCQRTVADGQTCKRDQVRSGVQRNNFCIIVDEECAKRAVELTRELGNAHKGTEDAIGENDDADEWNGISDEGQDGQEEEWCGITE